MNQIQCASWQNDGLSPLYGEMSPLTMLACWVLLAYWISGVMPGSSQVGTCITITEDGRYHPVVDADADADEDGDDNNMASTTKSRSDKEAPQ